MRLPSNVVEGRLEYSIAYYRVLLGLVIIVGRRTALESSGIFKAVTEDALAIFGLVAVSGSGGGVRDWLSRMGHYNFSGARRNGKAAPIRPMRPMNGARGALRPPIC